MKYDCFAYRGEEKCIALTEMLCKRQYCSFYKTEKQIQQQREKMDWRKKNKNI